MSGGLPAWRLPRSLRLRVVTHAAHLLGVAACSLLAGAAVAQTDRLPSFAAVRAAHQPSDLPLLARDGQPLQMLRLDDRVRRGAWVALEDMSPALRTAIVLGEDRRFWSHAGVDWPALAAGAWATAFNRRTRGASTLTMQLAALLDAELARPAGGRGAVAKLAQVQRARALDAAWRKTEILEVYLNSVPLRGEVVGVGAAAQLMFGRHASGLDSDEAALLAALVRAPNAAPATVQRRACELLRLQQLGCNSLALTAAQAFARRPAALGRLGADAVAPHAARQALRAWQATEPDRPVPATGLPSTLDARLQRLAQQALRRHLAELRGHAVQDGALLVLDNASGEVRAWVGSAGAASQAPAVDAVLARRQAGSTLKPFVYGLALEQGLVTAASRLADTPVQIDAGHGLYRPQNHDRGHQGEVSLRVALASSLNLPAVRVGAMLGPDAVFQRLQALGLGLRESGGWHGPALVLGSAEVTLLDLANAYRTLANGGVTTPVRLLPLPASNRTDPTNPAEAASGAHHAGTRVMPAAVAHLLADILADPAARAAGFGLDSPLVTRGWAAVKTGTSKDLRDNWCVGFTEHHTVAVWVGNADGSPMHGLSGVHGAAPLWRELVAALHVHTPSRPPAAVPAGLQRVAGEWFLPGTVPGPWRDGAAAFGISTPRAGSVVVLDPDIPPAAQRLVLAGAAAQWYVSGRYVGHGTQLSWSPRPGRHVVERRDAAGRVLDQVPFEVRLAPSAHGPR